MDNKSVLFVKFGERKYVKRLFNGKMYFSNAVKFRGIEKENRLKGQGDAFEAILQLKNGNAIMTETNTGLSFSQPNITVSLGLADTDNILYFVLLAYLQRTVLSEKRRGNDLLRLATQLEIL